MGKISQMKYEWHGLKVSTPVFHTSTSDSHSLKFAWTKKFKHHDIAAVGKSAGRRKGPWECSQQKLLVFPSFNAGWETGNELVSTTFFAVKKISSSQKLDHQGPFQSQHKESKLIDQNCVGCMFYFSLLYRLIVEREILRNTQWHIFHIYRSRDY